MLRRRVLPLFLVRGIFTLGACGSGDDAGSGSSPTTAASTDEVSGEKDSGGTALDVPEVDPCSLLTAAQVTAVLGTPVDTP
ncbi:MAG: hypothetical protein ACKO04_07580, partial [Actinomycetes bacterium]